MTDDASKPDPDDLLSGLVTPPEDAERIIDDVRERTASSEKRIPPNLRGAANRWRRISSIYQPRQDLDPYNQLLYTLYSVDEDAQQRKEVVAAQINTLESQRVAAERANQGQEAESFALQIRHVQLTEASNELLDRLVKAIAAQSSEASRQTRHLLIAAWLTLGVAVIGVIVAIIALHQSG